MCMWCDDVIDDVRETSGDLWDAKRSSQRFVARVGNGMGVRLGFEELRFVV